MYNFTLLYEIEEYFPGKIAMKSAESFSWKN